jgi:uncharacterized protein YlaN (UPF0358 family)
MDTSESFKRKKQIDNMICPECFKTSEWVRERQMFGMSFYIRSCTVCQWDENKEDKKDEQQ